MAANRSAGRTAEFVNIGINVVAASQSGRVETRPTQVVTMALPLRPNYVLKRKWLLVEITVTLLVVVVLMAVVEIL